MALTRTRSKEKENQYKAKITWKEIKRQKVLLFWSGVMVIYGIIFYYLPLAGWAMAFQNYKPKLGIFHSEFVGLQKFQTLFSDMTYPCHPEYACDGCDKPGCDICDSNRICHSFE